MVHNNFESIQIEGKASIQGPYCQAYRIAIETGYITKEELLDKAVNEFLERMVGNPEILYKEFNILRKKISSHNEVMDNLKEIDP